MNEKRKRFWMGRDIDELPRETLMVIIDHLSDQLNEAREGIHSIVKMYDLARQAKKRNGHDDKQKTIAGSPLRGDDEFRG